MIELPKYTLGVGDRFGREGEAQLEALCLAKAEGLAIHPVWNKSFREHEILHTQPDDVRSEAAAAVKALAWEAPYFVDADHINLATVDGFLDVSDFFTLDVAAKIGTEADPADMAAFVARHAEWGKSLTIDGIDTPLALSRTRLQGIATKYLAAVQEAGRIYRHIAEHKGPGLFVTEVSMDETPDPQTPEELVVILAAIADEGIPVQTIAPRFSGRFNKGVDYVGDVAAFAQEFQADVAVLDYAVQHFDLPRSLKLSVHSGSDKFSLYPEMARIMRATGAGLHLKTAGTTWLEELIGLAESNGDGVLIAKEIYRAALERYGELCGPYADVIDIKTTHLPTAKDVHGWSGTRFAAALRHDQACPDYNPDFRQLLHVAYKVAAEMGTRYLEALATNREIVARQVRDNLLERHIRPLFGGCTARESHADL